MSAHAFSQIRDALRVAIEMAHHYGIGIEQQHEESGSFACVVTDLTRNEVEGLRGDVQRLLAVVGPRMTQRLNSLPAQEPAKLPERIRALTPTGLGNFIDSRDVDEPLATIDDFRRALVKANERIIELQLSLDALHGAKFSDRTYHALTSRVQHAEADVERLTVQLAGCSAAALGATQDVAQQDDYGWSPAYQDVLDLRRKYDVDVAQLRAALAAADEKLVEREAPLCRRCREPLSKHHRVENRADILAPPFMLCPTSTFEE